MAIKRIVSSWFAKLGLGDGADEDVNGQPFTSVEEKHPAIIIDPMALPLAQGRPDDIEADAEETAPQPGRRRYRAEEG